MMGLTACLIVRNEERNLDACLSRLTGVADNLIVVDTGSTDASREIARRHGALVLDETWEDDFSRARNVALDHATDDWILYIDADELLDAGTEDFSFLKNAGAVAATVNFRAARNLTTYREHRIFRNRKDIRFRGVIHETVVPDITSILAHEQACIVHSNIHIEHLGYEGDLRHKHLRNHDLLWRAVDNDPERLYLWHALGECALGLGQLENAESAWRRALVIIRGREAQPADALIYADLIGLHYSANAPVLADIDELVTEACRRHDSDPLIKWWSARHLVCKRQYSRARRVLQEIVASGVEGVKDSPLAYDRRLFGAFSWALLGSCDLAEKLYAQAVPLLERAQADEPESHEIRLKLDLARALSRA